jgi:N-formylglutamate amidohydrolase
LFESAALSRDMAEPDTSPPFIRIGPEAPASPVVLSVPHAGRDYSQALLKSSRLPRRTLETLEDRLVDRLVWRALSGGATGIVATVPRAEIDLNRDEREIEPAMIVPPPPAREILQSAKTRGGLGLVPSRIGGAGAIWLQRMPEQELKRRIREVHRPYHHALAEALRLARNRFGVAILLDCHSMPPRDERSAPRVVLGDRYGTTMGPDLLAQAVETVEAAGCPVGLNVPYAGGYITSRHGKPAENIHAVQMEVDRSLYLDEKLREPGKGFDAAARMIADLAAALAGKAMEQPQAIAAE